MILAHEEHRLERPRLGQGRRLLRNGPDCGDGAMKAMILAAGRGARLQPLTDRRPKPMMKVGGAPLIGHQLRWLASAGVREVIINLHHLGEQIATYVGDGARHGLAVAYSREPMLLETGGGVVKALPWLGDEPFWLLNGDIYTDFPFRQFAKTLKAGCLAHLLLTPTPAFRQAGDFNWAPERCRQSAGKGGGAQTARPDAEGSEHEADAKALNGRVIGRGDAYVFCGLALLHPALFNGCRAEPFSLSRLYFQAVAAGTVSAQLWRGLWTDIGTPEQLAELRRKTL